MACKIHGGYGVMAAQEVVVLLARVRSSLATPTKISAYTAGIFVLVESIYTVLTKSLFCIPLLLVRTGEYSYWHHLC